MYSLKGVLLGLALASAGWAQADAWLDEDVVYIVTDAEKRTYRHLQNDEDRQRYIDLFWLRRDPTPDTFQNEFKQEHYRRIAYANERFRTKEAGWRSDRGRIYITFGRPDEIESHPRGERRERLEKWGYRQIEGVGERILFEFVDRGEDGGYRLIGSSTRGKTGI